LVVIQGQLNGGVTIERGEAELNAILEEIVQEGVPAAELAKVKNQAESTLVFSEVEMLNRAMNLAFYANLGDPEEVNREGEKLQAVTPDDVQRMAKRILRPTNTSTLYYRAKK
jgi:predicted Zn-dependent peptidase